MKFALAALVAAAWPLSAQSGAFLFSYQTTPSSAAITVSPNGTIVFPTIAAGYTATITMIVSNRDVVEWALTEGSTTGAAFSTNAKPATILPTGGTFFTVSYSPTQSSPTTGTLTLKLRGPNAVTASFAFNLSAGTQTTEPSTPRVEPQGNALVSYVNYNGGNQTIVNSGDTIPFPDTTVATRVSLALVINNRLAGATTTLAAASISGPGFELSGLPILPATIQAGGEMRFTIAFFPDAIGETEGQLRLTAGGSAYVLRLKGRAVAASLDVESVSAEGIAKVAPGGVLQFPDTATGSRSLLRLRIRNTGNAEGRFGVMSLSAPSFQLVDPPAPAPIRPGESVPFSIAFTPREVGQHFGQLRIDNAQYNLEGKATGAQLVMSLAFDGAVIPLRQNVLAVVPNTDVGARRTFFIEVSNTGDEAGFLSAASVNGDGFSMTRSMAFPVLIPAGGTVRVPAQFAPVETGAVRGSLLVHDQTFTLVGVGDEPPPLSRASFLGLPQRGEPLQQPAIALELAQAYPYDLTGRLTLAFTSESLIDDPAVQFISGNRTVDFRIPANTTRAIFGASLREIRLQTGSLAGTISLVAAISVGKFDLTRSTPPAATLEVPAGPPVVRSLAISARSSKVFDVVIGGAAPSRSINRFLIDLTPSPGARLQTTKLTVEVGQQFDAWFSSGNSRPYGGQFMAVVTIQLSADYSAVASLSVRAVNALGTSAAKSVVVTARD